MTLEERSFIYPSMYKGWYSIIDECFYSNHQVGLKALFLLYNTFSHIEDIHDSN